MLSGKTFELADFDRRTRMAIQYSDLVDLWGVDALIHFPADRFESEIGFHPDLFPPAGAMPADVPILFTAYISGPIKLFDLIEFQVGDEEPLRLAVIGGAPDNPNLLFGLDLATGVVALLDPETPAVELVSSSYALFVEFLVRLGRFISADPGGAARAAQARELRDELRVADPAAFADPESWWSIAFTQLTVAK
jgi:hypothetical protein